MRLDNSENDILYTKIYDNIIQYATLSLDDYNAHMLKKFDTEKVLDQHMDKIASKINNCKLYYIETIRKEVKDFIERYNLKEKLPGDKVTIMSNVMQELGISLEYLKEEYKLTSVETDHSNMCKYFLNKYILNKHMELDEENKRLEDELLKIKDRNRLNKSN
jgi:uncharacterized protein YpuA (DUF1002 family)